jgi:hypothetical protein
MIADAEGGFTIEASAIALKEKEDELCSRSKSKALIMSESPVLL